MKIFQRIMLCMVALLSTYTTYAQETIEENNDSNIAAVEEEKTINSIYISADELFNTIKEYNKADFIEINSFMMGIAKMAAPREERAFLDKLKSMRIIDLEPCSKDDRDRFVEFISTVELSSFEPAVNVCDEENENDRVRIYIKIKGDYITDMIVANWDEKECQLIQMSGKMALSDIEAVANGAGSSVM